MLSRILRDPTFGGAPAVLSLPSNRPSLSTICQRICNTILAINPPNIVHNKRITGPGATGKNPKPIPPRLSHLPPRLILPRQKFINSSTYTFTTRNSYTMEDELLIIFLRDVRMRILGWIYFLFIIYLTMLGLILFTESRHKT